MSPLLSEADRRWVEQGVREDLVYADVVSASVSVDGESGLISIEEVVFRQKDGRTVSVGMRPEDPERGVALDRYVGPGGWSRNGPQAWREVTAGDYMDEMEGWS